jgi:hypothetical protein
MKKIMLMIVVLLVSIGASAKDKPFNLKIHVTQVDSAGGTAEVRGGNWVDSEGNSHWSSRGGESYLYHVMTFRIDGDNREYTGTVPGGRKNAWLQIGNYAGRQGKHGLEVMWHDHKDKAHVEPIVIRSERVVH